MKRFEKIKLLLVEDDPDDHILFKYSLSEIKNSSYELSWANNYDTALEMIKRNDHDIYFFDYLLGARTGLDLIKDSVEAGVSAPIIILTGIGNKETDMKAMELGAADYLVKGEIDTEKLERCIRYCIEQHRMVKKLRTSEAKFRNIFENSYDVIYLSNSEGKILDVNKAAERLFGYTREEMLNMNAAGLYENTKDRERFTREIRESGSCANFEVVLLDKEGNKKYCTITANIQKTDDSGMDFYQGIIHDMTMRKKAEQDLITAEKLAFVGKIARILAHEVRNPLTNISLSVEQLEDLIQEENYRIYFDIIKRNGKRINELITELLENSRPMELKKSAVSVQKLLNSTIDLARDRADLKNIKLETNLNLKNENILADESKLSIALLNILVNAIEAVQQNTGIIKVYSVCSNGKCRVSIEDNGCGISRDHINKVFDPYYTSKPNGMGLGLSATQNIISTHKGTISIESEPNKGTRFNIELDLVQDTVSV